MKMSRALGYIAQGLAEHHVRRKIALALEDAVFTIGFGPGLICCNPSHLPKIVPVK